MPLTHRPNRSPSGSPDLERGNVTIPILTWEQRRWIYSETFWDQRFRNICIHGTKRFPFPTDFGSSGLEEFLAGRLDGQSMDHSEHARIRSHRGPGDCAHPGAVRGDSDICPSNLVGITQSDCFACDF